ncbi:MAG TPA: hypothetical protein VHY91_27355 [Pirellulales bacterium]|jgi:hypothetical protein|nr:hypothetical protein [Pirellulales bacterium]
MSIATEDIRFSANSLELRDRFQALLTARLRELAISRAKQRGEEIVTEADIEQCLGAAIEDALKSLKTPK